MSQITTHILDTSRGQPAEGVKIELQAPNGNNWKTIGSGHTNSDGRISDLLPKATLLSPGPYRMYFHVGEYYQKQALSTFYPEISIVFEVFDESHYHVPLLLNPFGYSTYRGS